MIEVIKSYPLATLISVKNGEPLVTHLPLVYSEGKLSGHIDTGNPQAELLKDGNSVKVIFGGPQCYISPSIYTTPNLPTWNYVKVHLKGTVTSVEDALSVKQALMDMAKTFEAPEHKFQLDPDDPRMDALINYIKGFEIEITHWEGKFKLSQDKSPENLRNAREELIKTNQENIRTFMEKIFKL